MYAIIRTGGKQYRVQPGDVLRVEKLDVEPGKELDLTEVLFVGGEKTMVGEPTVKNAKVTVVVTRQHRGPKVIIFKKKRRQGYRRMGGHRQAYTELFVKAITTADGQVKSDSVAKVYSPERKEERVAKVNEWREANRQQIKTSEPVEKKTKAPTKKAAGKGGAKKKTAKAKKAAGAKKSAKKSAAKKSTSTKKKA